MVGVVGYLVEVGGAVLKLFLTGLVILFEFLPVWGLLVPDVSGAVNVGVFVREVVLLDFLGILKFFLKIHLYHLVRQKSHGGLCQLSSHFRVLIT